MNVQTGDIRQFDSVEEAAKAGYTAVLTPEEERFLSTMTSEERVAWWKEKRSNIHNNLPSETDVIKKIYKQAEQFESRNGFRRKPKATGKEKGSTFCESIKDRKYFKKRSKQ